MRIRLAILAAALALPAIAVIAWMLSPSPSQPAGDEAAPVLAADTRRHDSSPAHAAPPPVRAGSAAAEHAQPGITRRSEDIFPDTASATAPIPPIPPNSPAPSVSPRYTLNTQPNAAALARQMENQPPLMPDERIRVVPAETGSDSIVLRLDTSLHDPVAWFDDGKATDGAQADVKGRIADRFATEVAAAASQPAKAFDGNWQAARAKANADYGKFFGTEASNRAGINAGRAALAK